MEEHKEKLAKCMPEFLATLEHPRFPYLLNDAPFLSKLTVTQQDEGARFLMLKFIVITKGYRRTTIILWLSGCFQLAVQDSQGRT
jgi:hypothetical protein